MLDQATQIATATNALIQNLYLHTMLRQVTDSAFTPWYFEVVINIIVTYESQLCNFNHSRSVLT